MVEADDRLAPLLLEGCLSPKASVRYGCAAVLVALTAKYPTKLYPYFEKIVDLLDSKYRIITWNALAAIANLTASDVDAKFDTIFDRYYSYLGSEYMVTVANTVVNTATIVANKPYMADHVAAELLKVQNLRLTPHLTEECTKVIAEKAIRTFKTLMKYTENKAALIDFAEKHQNSSRVSLRREAQTFLKKWK
jgi:hypothetical protein